MVQLALDSPANQNEASLRVILTFADYFGEREAAIVAAQRLAAMWATRGPLHADFVFLWSPSRLRFALTRVSRRFCATWGWWITTMLREIGAISASPWVRLISNVANMPNERLSALQSVETRIAAPSAAAAL
ncbi:MAG: hypothetical protein WDM77_14685 [Steroidobacteraceae bacterium]